jgi:metal-sulfur cluster biosynthetic enzyme
MNPPDETALLNALRAVVDPEIGLNIVDLGLVYSAEVRDGIASVKMTLTTRGCPMHESLIEGARAALLEVPGVTAADVEIVWDPPWHPSMITEAGRASVGLV